MAEIIRRAILRARVNVNVKYSAARLYGPRIKGQSPVGPNRCKLQKVVPPSKVSPNL